MLALIPARSSRVVSLIDVYRQPWSAWWIRLPSAAGRRERSAYSSTAHTRSASATSLVSQATTLRENASRIEASHNGPSPVGITVRSVTHSRFGALAVKLRFTRSPGRGSAGFGTVVRGLRAGAIPAMAFWRISRSTRLRETASPSRLSTAWIRGEPYTPPESAWMARMRSSNCASRNSRLLGTLARRRQSPKVDGEIPSSRSTGSTPNASRCSSKNPRTAGRSGRPRWRNTRWPHEGSHWPVAAPSPPCAALPAQPRPRPATREPPQPPPRPCQPPARADAGSPRPYGSSHAAPPGEPPADEPSAGSPAWAAPPGTSTPPAPATRADTSAEPPSDRLPSRDPSRHGLDQPATRGTLTPTGHTYTTQPTRYQAA